MKIIKGLARGWKLHNGGIYFEPFHRPVMCERVYIVENLEKKQIAKDDVTRKTNQCLPDYFINAEVIE